MINDTSQVLDDFQLVQPLPSGVTVEVEEWSVDDVSLMTTQGGNAREVAVNKVLQKCRIVDDPHEVYGQQSGSKFRPTPAMTGDRSALLIYQRVASFGHNFDFEFTCGVLGCQRKVAWEFDLRRLLLPYVITSEGELLAEDAELEEENTENMQYTTVEGVPAVICPRLGSKPILLGDERIYWRTLTEKGLEVWKQIQQEEPPIFTDRRGNKVFWRFFTGAQEAEMAKDQITNLAAMRNKSIVLRVVKIQEKDDNEGNPGKIVRSRDHLKWVKRWSSRASDTFLAEAQSLEPGIELTVEVQCPFCGEHQDIELPMNAAFFSPMSSKRRSGNR